MDSFSPDLRDALDEELARAGGGAGSSNASSSSAAKKSVISCCVKCEKVAPDVDRLRWCGGCHAVRYCSETGSRAGWPVHKLVCKKKREMRDNAVAGFEADGGDKKHFKQQDRDVTSWYHGVPGLANGVGLLAWTHHSDSSIVVVTASTISYVEGVSAQVSVMPRSIWDEDPRFLDTFTDDIRESIRMGMHGADFCPDKHYVTIRHTLFHRAA
jgi:hypothetical protein